MADPRPATLDGLDAAELRERLTTLERMMVAAADEQAERARRYAAQSAAIRRSTTPAREQAAAVTAARGTGVTEARAILRRYLEVAGVALPPDPPADTPGEAPPPIRHGMTPIQLIGHLVTAPAAAPAVGGHGLAYKRGLDVDALHDADHEHRAADLPHSRADHERAAGEGPPS